MISERLTEAIVDLRRSLFLMRVTFDWVKIPIRKLAKFAETVEMDEQMKDESDDN